APVLGGDLLEHHGIGPQQEHLIVSLERAPLAGDIGPFLHPRLVLFPELHVAALPVLDRFGLEIQSAYFREPDTVAPPVYFEMEFWKGIGLCWIGSHIFSFFKMMVMISCNVPTDRLPSTPSGGFACPPPARVDASSVSVSARSVPAFSFYLFCTTGRSGGNTRYCTTGRAASGKDIPPANRASPARPLRDSRSRWARTARRNEGIPANRRSAALTRSCSSSPSAAVPPAPAQPSPS